MRISYCSSDVCSSDLQLDPDGSVADRVDRAAERNAAGRIEADGRRRELRDVRDLQRCHLLAHAGERRQWRRTAAALQMQQRSEEHTSELQSLMRISYAVFCLKKKKKTRHTTYTQHNYMVL